MDVELLARQTVQLFVPVYVLEAVIVTVLVHVMIYVQDALVPAQATVMEVVGLDAAARVVLIAVAHVKGYVEMDVRVHVEECVEVHVLQPVHGIVRDVLAHVQDRAQAVQVVVVVLDVQAVLDAVINVIQPVSNHAQDVQDALLAAVCVDPDVHHLVLIHVLQRVLMDAQRHVEHAVARVQLRVQQTVVLHVKAHVTEMLVLRYFSFYGGITI